MRYLLSFFLILSLGNSFSQKIIETDVLVVGGGVGGTTAAIQSARGGVKTLIVEPTYWLGGMLTAAGVSATDGNFKLKTGIWGEFQNALYKHYNTNNLATGWVSNFLFEPHVGDSIFKAWCTKSNINVLYEWIPIQVIIKKNKIISVVFQNKNNEQLIVKAKLTIDGTELGDIVKLSNTAYSLGLETPNSNEMMAAGPNDIVQDITYAAILKDYGKSAYKLIPRPYNYDSTQFFKSCANIFNENKKDNAPQKMLDYGKLPNNKYMINWPIFGNDIYLNIVEKNENERKIILEQAKNMTLQFIYFIQKDLGLTQYGLANDEFGTPDNLPLIAYHRESRRALGKIRFSLNNIQYPYNSNLYKTSISVGDYPIDHHHRKNKNMKEMFFPPVPSYAIPMGALVPIKTKGLLLSEKNISVSNVVNGTTRLQPVVMATGQATGAIAAWCIKNNKEPEKINIREIQNELLKWNCYLLPFVDVDINDKFFNTFQQLGILGIFKSVGKPFKWANQTYIFPDSIVTKKEWVSGLKSIYPNLKLVEDELLNTLSTNYFIQTIDVFLKYKKLNNYNKNYKTEIESIIANKTNLTRKDIAKYWNILNIPLTSFKVDFTGN